MPIVAQCQCGKSFKVKDEYAGKRGKCPQCGEVVTIPKAAAPAAPSRPTAPKPTASAAPARPATARPSAPKPTAARPAPPPRAKRPEPDGFDLDALGELEQTGTVIPEEAEAVAAPSAPAGKPAAKQKACPSCGSIISAFARVCEHCGAAVVAGAPAAVGYATPKKYQAASGEDENPSVVEILLCVFCGLVAIILAIVYITQGKPKGKKMLRILAILWAIGFAIGLIRGFAGR